MNILDQLAAHARERVAADKARIPLEELQALAAAAPASAPVSAPAPTAASAPAPEQAQAQAGSPQETAGNAFLRALQKPGLSFLCEVKRASPSKGIIAPDFPYLQIAREYQAAGADAVSCLTEPKWFLGSDAIFQEIRQELSIPMLRKDFTVDAYQIWQAKVMGANAVLLICALLDTQTIAAWLDLCSQLGLAALVETHDEAEIRQAVSAGAQIIGVNNRNLKDFSVDFSNAARLRDQIPPECVYVAESGVTGPEDAAVLRRIGADAVLVGEALMRAPDKAGMLQAMREAAAR